MTVKLDIKSHTMFDKIMDFLNKLPQNGLHVEVDEEKNEKRKLSALSSLHRSSMNSPIHFLESLS